MNSIIRLDTRGRLVIPNEFRESLKLQEGDEVLISLDKKMEQITITPIYGKTSNIIKMEIEFGDTPGCLAKIAKKIASMKVDLIMTESKSSQRGKKARWYIVADISKSPYKINQVKQILMQSGFIDSMSASKITRDSLHR